MNTIKFYRQRSSSLATKSPHAFEVVRVKIPGRQKYGAPGGHISIAQADAAMYRQGFTRRPGVIKPHGHAHQRPGYHQPSQQQQRRARQTLRKAGRKAA